MKKIDIEEKALRGESTEELLSDFKRYEKLLIKKFKK